MANQAPGGAISVGLIILGAALALIGSIVVEFVRGWISGRRKARTVVGILLVEIELIVVGLRTVVMVASKYEELKISIGEVQPTLEAVRGALRRLDHYRDGILLIKEERVRQDLLDFLPLVEVVCAGAMVSGIRPIHEIIEPLGEMIEKGSGLLEQLRKLKT